MPGVQHLLSTRMTLTRASQPIVQLGSHGTDVHASRAQVDDLRAEFGRQHFIRLPQLLTPSLLDRVVRAVESGPFTERRHGDHALEDCLIESNMGAFTLQLVTNCATFFELISRITQCGPIDCFTGRVYRRLATLGHYGSWHTDTFDPSRLVAMSMNLGGEYQGGELELRPVGSSSGVLIDNRRLGDAVVFRVAPEFRTSGPARRGKRLQNRICRMVPQTPERDKLF